LITAALVGIGPAVALEQATVGSRGAVVGQNETPSHDGVQRETVRPGDQPDTTDGSGSGADGFCGDGSTDYSTGEECDHGSGTAADSCRSDCTILRGDTNGDGMRSIHDGGDVQPFFDCLFGFDCWCPDTGPDGQACHYSADMNFDGVLTIVGFHDLDGDGSVVDDGDVGLFVDCLFAGQCLPTLTARGPSAAELSAPGEVVGGLVVEAGSTSFDGGIADVHVGLWHNRTLVASTRTNHIGVWAMQGVELERYTIVVSCGNNTAPTVVDFDMYATDEVDTKSIVIEVQCDEVEKPRRTRGG
jgi:hypothetical protein